MKYKIQNTKYKIQNTKYKIQNTIYVDYIVVPWFGVEKARGLIQKEGKWGSSETQCLTQLPNISFTLFHKYKYKHKYRRKDIGVNIL